MEVYWRHLFLLQEISFFKNLICVFEILMVNTVACNKLFNFNHNKKLETYTSENKI